MVMPEMSGAVLAERLTATRAELMVLQMSGYTDYGSAAAEPTVHPARFPAEALHAGHCRARGQSRVGFHRRAH